MAGEDGEVRPGPEDGDTYDPDRLEEFTGGDAPRTPGLDDAPWGELANAVRSHGEIPVDLDVDDDQSTDAGSDEPDGRDEMMDAWRAAQGEADAEKGDREPIIDLRGPDHGEELELDLTDMNHLPPPKEDE